MFTATARLLQSTVVIVIQSRIVTPNTDNKWLTDTTIKAKRTILKATATQANKSRPCTKYKGV